MGGELSLENIVEIDCMGSDPFVVFCASARSMAIRSCRLILFCESSEERIELLGLGKMLDNRVFLKHENNLLPLPPACPFIEKFWL